MPDARPFAFLQVQGGSLAILYKGSTAIAATANRVTQFRHGRVEIQALRQAWECDYGLLGFRL